MINLRSQIVTDSKAEDVSMRSQFVISEDGSIIYGFNTREINRKY